MNGNAVFESECLHVRLMQVLSSTGRFVRLGEHGCNVVAVGYQSFE